MVFPYIYSAPPLFSAKLREPTGGRTLDIKTSLAAAVPSETAGRRSSERFEYQVNWALSELISKHQGGDEYLFIFEYLDDVVIIEGAIDGDSPSATVEFCQVKTKAGQFTLSKLLERKKGKEKKPSIIGKLFSHTESFDPSVLRLSIVSNAFCDVLPEGADEILFSDLNETDKKKIKAKLTAELSSYDEALLSKLRYRRSELGLSSQEIFLSGMVAKLLQEVFKDLPVRHIDVWLKTIQSEIKSKNNASVPSNATFDQISHLKGINRNDFERNLKKTYGAYPVSSPAETVKAVLPTLGFTVNQVFSVSNVLTDIQAAMFDPNDLVMRRIVEQAVDALTKAGWPNPDADVCKKLLPEITLPSPYRHLGEPLKLGVLLWVSCEKPSEF